MAFLEVESLTKSFGGLVAVNEVSIHVDKGEILGLIGPNGSGKSTLLSLITGLQRPSSGAIRFEGTELAYGHPHRIARSGIRIVFQHSRPLRRQTVRENLRLGLLNDRLWQPNHKREQDVAINAIAETLGLTEELDSTPDALAFAALRRLELARALISRPRLLLLDEPFAGLAPSETQEFSDLVRNTQASGCTILLIDHNVKAVTGLVSRIIVMDAGRKIAEGEPKSISQDKKVREIYFGNAAEGGGSTTEDRTHKQRDSSTLLDVEIESLFYGKAQALRGIKFQIKRGEFTSVVGLNGAGKTSLLNCILRFVDYQGQITYDRQPIHGKTPAAIAAAGIALCPETRDLFSYMSIEENLDLGGHALNALELKREREYVYGLFPKLYERRRQKAVTLSGGEQQMLAIGRALMQRPRLLLLDEPTLGLAPLVMQGISEALWELQRAGSLTILLSEQNITFAIDHSDELYLIETGQFTWAGSPDRFRNEMLHKML